VYEEAWIALKYRRGDFQTIRWNGFTITETKHDPYVRLLAFGRTKRWTIQSRILALLVPPGGVVFDVGANIGLMTLLFSRIDGVTIHAFEPGTRAYRCLERNVAQNGLRRVHLTNAGLSNVEGPRFIGPPSAGQHERYGRDNRKTGLFSVHADPHSAAAQQYGQTARFITLDGYRQAHAIDRLDYLKIDVEGHESAVIAGGVETLAETRPICQIELNAVTAAVAGQTPTGAVETIANLGYILFAGEGARLTEVVPPIAASAALGRPVMDVYAIPSERAALIARLRSGDW
jgi:FkbM family methyltransferase